MCTSFSACSQDNLLFGKSIVLILTTFFFNSFYCHAELECPACENSLLQFIVLDLTREFLSEFRVFSFVKHLYAWQPKPALTSGLNFPWILQASKSRERIFEGNSHSGLVNREKNHHQVIQLDFVIYKATKFYLRDRQHF